MTRDHIRNALNVIFDQIFNQGQADLLPGVVSGPYIQHNPLFANGLDGIMGYIKQVGRIPCEVKRIAIDGDLAFVHVRYLDCGGQETAGVDIFRLDRDGKIVEHWDVLQPVPAPPTTPTRCSDKHAERNSRSSNGSNMRRRSHVAIDPRKMAGRTTTHEFVACRL